MPFSATTLGVRIGSLAFNLAEAIVAMANGEPLSTFDFTETSITEDGNEGRQALGGSGVRAYTRLPVFEGVDLETFCPGESSSNIAIADDSPFNAEPEPLVEIVTETEEKFPGWGIALIVVFGVLAVGIAGFMIHIINMEKQGKPIFAETTQTLA